MVEKSSFKSGNGVETPDGTEGVSHTTIGENVWSALAEDWRNFYPLTICRWFRIQMAEVAERDIKPAISQQ